MQTNTLVTKSTHATRNRTEVVSTCATNKEMPSVVRAIHLKTTNSISSTKKLATKFILATEKTKRLVTKSVTNLATNTNVVATKISN
jgi:hypothetical protein